MGCFEQMQHMRIDFPRVFVHKKKTTFFVIAKWMHSFHVMSLTNEMVEKQTQV